ncbi:hypothetical protein J7443_08370 [Tropicibacter sp. R15_0]|uniref:thioredoxin family protein n=1 Tax=Tropicibacter sp. R15_0 TaxID=2821101 RepID=UPI001ADD5762|nr:thioredoxin domain-containing protein [Tropicibacter sp. R15_0]MBO9465239.1 hypothetical protein [Tropicibacter sp. R15_0]
MVDYIDDTDFDAKVLKSDTDNVVLFRATWAGSSNFAYLNLERAEKSFPKTAKAFYLDMDYSVKVPQTYSVNIYPTFLVFQNGKEVFRYSSNPAPIHILGWISDIED